MARKTQGPAVTDPRELAAELERERELAAAKRADELARARAEAAHQRATRDVAEESRRAELERTEREAAAAADAELAALYRTYRAEGERTRIKALMARSGEARALALARLRALNLRILVPVLVGCAAWSTTGVQAGAARLMGVDAHTTVWWALWILEPVLISAVVWIIIVRARLAANGGKLDNSAEKIAAGSLVTSIFLNLVAAIPQDAAHAGPEAIGSMFAHALGPVGAAVTAHLIGVIDHSIADADPWHDEHGDPTLRLAEMFEHAPGAQAHTVPVPRPEEAPLEGARRVPEAFPVTAWPVPRQGRRALPVIARPAAEAVSEPYGGDGQRTGAYRPRRAKAGTPSGASRRRPNKGVPVPPSARPSATPPRRRTDDELVQELTDAIDAGRVPEDAPYRAIKAALGIGYERARHVRELYEQRARDLEAEIVADLPDTGDRPGRDGQAAVPARRPLTVVGGER
ncbi:hypothetical protein [Actinomadura sp. SCN-SB]|uniref:hypothetical protein n=1 Tax=Actinomadura sp. SCN-SB TaxID=3373092 RepID=UPI0037516294